jgi:hypothetical protein
MGITKLTTNGVNGTKYDIASADNYYMEPIATTLLSSSAGSVTFSNIPQGYKHLQLRYFCNTTRVGGASGSGTIQFNGDTAAGSYSNHALYGQGSSAAAYGAANTNNGLWYYGDTTTFVAGIVDILDYANVNKFKTMRSLTGFDQNGAGQIGLVSLGWMNTAAITSIVLTPTSYSFNTNSRFSLYGIRG